MRSFDLTFPRVEHANENTTLVLCTAVICSAFDLTFPRVEHVMGSLISFPVRASAIPAVSCAISSHF
jgi:hypothetical protein